MQKLPADPLSMILGIASLVLTLASCCCGLSLLIFAPLVLLPIFLCLALSVIGLVAAQKSLKLYNQHPDDYSPSSRSNVYYAKIINIVSLSFLLLSIILIAGGIISLGASFSDTLEKIKSGEFENYEYDDKEWEYEEDQDSIQQQSDTLVIEKIEVEEIDIPENEKRVSIFIKNILC